MTYDTLLKEFLTDTSLDLQRELLSLFIQYSLAESADNIQAVWEIFTQLKAKLPSNTPGRTILTTGLEWRLQHVQDVINEAMAWAQQHVPEPVVVMQCFPQAWDVLLSDSTQNKHTIRIQHENIYPPGGRDVETVAHITVLQS